VTPLDHLIDCDPCLHQVDLTELTDPDTGLVTPEVTRMVLDEWRRRDLAQHVLEARRDGADQRWAATIAHLGPHERAQVAHVWTYPDSWCRPDPALRAETQRALDAAYQARR
jgi:hypothetical protein